MWENILWEIHNLRDHGWNNCVYFEFKSSIFYIANINSSLILWCLQSDELNSNNHMAHIKCPSYRSTRASISFLNQKKSVNTALISIPHSVVLIFTV